MMDRKLTATFDIKPGMEILDELTIEDEVEIVLKGKVTAIRGGEESMERDWEAKDPDKAPKKKRIYPGSVTLELKSVRMARQGEFDAMMEDGNE